MLWPLTAPENIPPKGFGHLLAGVRFADGVQHFAAQDGGFFYVIDKDDWPVVLELGDLLTRT